MGIKLTKVQVEEFCCLGYFCPDIIVLEVYSLVGSSELFGFCVGATVGGGLGLHWSGQFFACIQLFVSLEM